MEAYPELRKILHTYGVRTHEDLCCLRDLVRNVLEEEDIESYKSMFDEYTMEKIKGKTYVAIITAMEDILMDQDGKAGELYQELAVAAGWPQ